jgi:predicted nucleic acid-binding protein
VRAERHASPRVAMSEEDFQRAAEVMELLARKGKHRAAGIRDPLITAVAERAGLCVIHYDHDEVMPGPGR